MAFSESRKYIVEVKYVLKITIVENIIVENRMYVLVRISIRWQRKREEAVLRLRRQ